MQGRDRAKVRAFAVQGVSEPQASETPNGDPVAHLDRFRGGLAPTTDRLLLVDAATAQLARFATEEQLE